MKTSRSLKLIMELETQLRLARTNGKKCEVISFQLDSTPSSDQILAKIIEDIRLVSQLKAMSINDLKVWNSSKRNKGSYDQIAIFVQCEALLKAGWTRSETETKISICHGFVHSKKPTKEELKRAKERTRTYLNKHIYPKLKKQAVL